MPRPMNLIIAVDTGEPQAGVALEESLLILQLEVIERDLECS